MNDGLERAGSLGTLLANIVETNRIVSRQSIYIEEAEAIGEKAIPEQYGLGDTEVKKYFVYEGDTYWNDPSCVHVAYYCAPITTLHPPEIALLLST